jgi:sugar lactone lactonase YvrE
MSYEFIQCSDEVNEIGEGPLWHAGTDSVYWIDVGLKPLKLFQFNISTQKTQVFQLPSRASSIRLKKDGNLILGFQKGMAIFNINTYEITNLEVQGIDFSQERLNDSAADTMGRLWIGSFDRQLKNNIGKLYKIDSSLQAQSMEDSMMMSNGIAWSPDNKTLYFCDSRPGKIYAYDFDIEKGTISNKRTFMDFVGRKGRPDGCAMDQDGFLWVAEIDAGQLLKIRNDSYVEEEIHLPVKKPTSLTFGGKDLDTLFITSMTFGLSEEEIRKQPLSGKLFCCKVKSKGMQENTI